MRLIIFSVCVLLCTSFTACSKDDDNNLDLSIEYLNQSSWKGEYSLKTKDGEIYSTSDIGITFTTEDEGLFTIFSGDADRHNSSEYIVYSIDKKKLIIARRSIYDSTLISGDWFVLEKNKNKMVLVKDLETSTYTSYLHLTRTY